MGLFPKKLYCFFKIEGFLFEFDSIGFINLCKFF